MPLSEVYVSIGANLGNPKRTVEKALAAIKKMVGVSCFCASRLYRTAPVSAVPQPDYVNGVCRFETALGPKELLSALQQIECQLGKGEKPKEAPRAIDLDLLFYGDQAMDLPTLTLPHPAWKERLFVLAPLRELTSSITLLGQKMALDPLIASLSEQRAELIVEAVPVGDFAIGPDLPLAVMAGPCVIESEAHSLRAAERLSEIFSKVSLPFIFKSSFDKANRSSIDSFRGPGLEEGLRILQKVKERIGLPIVTDIHQPEQAAPVSEVCDILQIPAFLCRQTDLLVAAGKTGAVVSIKKGQMMAPWEMKHVVDKVLATGNRRVICVDRGTSFGYNRLISDMRAIPLMQQLGFPVCFDATHSVQQPGSLGGLSGGEREFVPVLARAAVAAGADCIFIESHEDPKRAKSDAASMLPFDTLLPLLQQLERIRSAVKNG